MRSMRFNTFMFSQSMFFKLLASFLLIIIILSSFYFISYNFFIKCIESEIINNTNERLDNAVSKIDKSLLQIKKMMIKLSLEDFLSSLEVKEGFTPNVKKQFIEAYKSYGLLVDYNTSYINTIFILPEQALDDNLMTTESSYNIRTYFNLFYNNPIYTKKFWQTEISRDFNFKVYPSGQFIDKSHYSYRKDVSEYLMPVALKNKASARYIMAAYINIRALLHDVDDSFTNNFCILNENNEVLYSSLEDSLMGYQNFNNINKYSKVSRGYAFIRHSPESSLKYFRFLPNDKFQAQLSKTNTIFKLVAILSLGTGILISIYIVKRFNNPVKQIIDILNKSHNPNVLIPKAFNFKYLRDSIQSLLSENSSYMKDLDSKASILKTLSYQASIKNIYPDLKNPFDVKRNYVLIYFKIHFKSNSDALAQNKNKTSYYLAELIQLYVSACFNDSVTFQAENDQIVSVINISSEKSDIKSSIHSIANKLKSEEEYVYFTIVISKVYSDISELNTAYNRSLELSEYRIPISDTQILTDPLFGIICNNYYFSLEQVEMFINKLSNGQRQECLNIVSNIMDYNFRKGVNCFYIRMLCNEIIDCCIKVLIKTYYTVPEEIEIKNIYYQIRLSSTIEDFKTLLANYISAVADFIASNRKQSDYIIDSITNYIEEHYTGEVYVDLLADMLKLTSNYVSSYFKDKVGINLNDYINDFRVRKSFELLESSSLKIKDIAVQVGIPNVNTFIRTFKKYVGKTPVDYRRQLHT